MLKPITLIITQEFFNQIISGEKKEEYRSLSEYYISRFCNFKGDEFIGMKDYKSIILAVGYSKTRKWAQIEVKGIFIDTFETIIPEGFKKGDECFTIELGRVLKQN